MAPEMAESERKSVAGRVRMQRQAMFGTKSDAYKAAGLNPATWDRLEAGLPIREDRLIAALKVLFPQSGGDWTAISLERDGGQVLRESPGSEGYFMDLEGWVLELQRRIEALEAHVLTDEREGGTDAGTAEAGKKSERRDGGGNVVKFGPGSKRDQMMDSTIDHPNAADHPDNDRT